MREQGNSACLKAIFSPEHGLEGTHEATACVNSDKNSRWGCPVYSLHGKVRKPTPEMLRDLDVIVIDLQDIGLRCFTYLSSMVLMLEAAAEQKIPVIVLDRPNPLAMWGAQGPRLSKGYQSFVGKINTPLLHGNTIGGLAKQVAAACGADLTVIPALCSGLDYFLARPFIPPSPNLMSVEHLLAYPLAVVIEGTNYSEGRGTNYPFLQFGAPWVNADRLAQALNNVHCAGIYFQPVHFTPRAMPGIADHPKHENKRCHGVFIHVFDPTAVKPIYVAQMLLKTLFSLYPKQSSFVRWGDRYGIDLLIGNKDWRLTIQKKKGLLR